ncbi:MAG: class I SAM-dependent methyltransferase [Cyclobacteriaceae bacterium]|nr:class I SAM-dependent methyltransferase [Cyclobacteriaceae bacterium]
MKKKGRAYYETVRPEMLEFIPKSVKKTIEFGCSNGQFSKDIKEKFNTESWGIDIDSEAVKNANAVLDKVILSGAMEVLKDLPKEYFDCVICNDFLEHIINPSEFLIALKPYVTKNAVLICSLPNVRYWKNVSELLFEKDWRYREEGILDSTHLRFFTKKSIQRFLKQSGLELEKIEGINPTKSIRFQIPNILTFGVHNDMKYLQFASRSKFL